MLSYTGIQLSNAAAVVKLTYSHIILFLDQAALETEARISPLVNEKKRLFNDLLTAKGKKISMISFLFVAKYANYVIHFRFQILFLTC